MRAVRKYYSSMADCVLTRLDWRRPPAEPLPAELVAFCADLVHPDHIRTHGELLVRCADDRLTGHSIAAGVVRNEWPYSVDPDVIHYVVWSRLPVFHAESQRPTARETERGYAGFSWTPPERDSPASAELARFVRLRWPPSAFEAIWFACVECSLWMK